MQRPAAGDVFEGRYEILDEIGRGGFGVVVRARDRQSGQLVALKYLVPDPSGYPERVALRFADEARALATLRHPHIVALLDFGQTPDGLLYIVMEYLSGGELGPPDAARLDLTLVVGQLLEALEHTHRAGLLHRDIKPPNILFDESRQIAKLVDFGLAKMCEPIDGRPGLTATGIAVGTARYMAPEVLMGDPATAQSDLYALGLVMIELLLGVDGGRQWHRTSAANTLDPSAARQSFAPGVLPEPLRATLEAMAQGRASLRPPSATHALSLLRTPVPPAPSSDTRPRPTAPAARRETAQPHIGAGSRRPPGQILVVLSIVGAIVCVVFAARYASQRADPPKSEAAAVRVKTTQPALPPPPPPASSEDVGIDASALPSPGCGADAPFERSGFVRRGVLAPKEWRVLIPANYDPDRAHPVLVVFHADLFSGRMMVDHLRLEALVDRERAVVIAPDFPTFPKTDRRAQQDQMPGALKAAAEALCLDPQRIYVLGFGVGSDGAMRLARYPWVTALATGGYFPPAHDAVPPALSTPRDLAPPHLYLATTESKVYPAAGGRSCAIVNMRERISLEEHEAMLRDINDCDGKPKPVHDANDETCFEWSCASRLVSCHLAGGLFWPGSGRKTWPVQQIHGCEIDPTISEFDATSYAWKFFESSPDSASELAPW